MRPQWLPALVTAFLFIAGVQSFAASTDNEYLINMDASALQKFGLYYPVTYKFRLPPNSSGLAAQYRHSESSWNTLPVKQKTDFFNGIDAVRFDYAGDFAYVSVKFSRSSDNIYLRIIDGSGQPVPVDFDSIPTFYDDRKAAVTITLDDWIDWSDPEFKASADYLAPNGFYFSVGLLTGNVPWNSVQQKINQYGDQMEISSHSAFHSSNAAEYTANGYETEIIGSRDAIRNNLTFDAHPYVPVYMEPWGYYDATVNSMITSGDYLLSRSNLWSPVASQFVAWEPGKGRYGRAGVTFDDSTNKNDGYLLSQANAVFDDVIAAGGVYHLVDHPNQGLWQTGSYLLQHLNHAKGRKDLWYVPFGPLYQYHYVQEMRGDLSVQRQGITPLTAAFSSSSPTGTSPLSVSFHDTSTGEITAWQWDFGDYTTNSQQNPVHVYSGAGLYTVRLTVTGPGGANTRTQTNYIQVTPPSVSITAPAKGGLFAAPATIPINVSATASSGATISRVAFYSGSTLLGSVTSSPYSFFWNNAPAGSYSLTAVVTDSYGETATSLPVEIEVVNSSLPTPWLSRDIGSVGVTGKTGYQNGTFVVSGSGSDIWGTADSFRYVYQPLAGDGQIVARVAALQNSDDWTKGGVMIRETLSASSAYAMMALTPIRNGAVFQWRLSGGGTSLLTNGPLTTPSYWVKLVRSGNMFSSYVSSNGVNWAAVGSETINMASQVYIGLAVTSHNNAALCTAIIKSVSLTGEIPNIPPSVSITAPTGAEVYIAPATVPISASATAGTGATVARVDFYAGNSLVGSSATSPYTFTWNNVPVGSYSLTAQVVDSLGTHETSSPVTITVTADNSLPLPWLSQDIGSVGVAGSAGYQNGTYSVKGSGADIWNSADSFRYVYKPFEGNGQIIARVTSLQNTNAWAKGGVMIRSTLAANSINAFMALTPANGAAFQRRVTTGASSVSTARSGVTAPYWVKLVRSGSIFSGYVSSNGVTWVLVGSSTITMPSTVYIGIAVTSHSNLVLGTLAVDSVTVQGETPVNVPTVNISFPSAGASYAAPATIPVTALATPGTGATITRVDYYAGTNFLGSATASPYSFTWSNVAEGNYSLTAQVTDSLGTTATSSPVDIIVTGTAFPYPWQTRDIGTVGLAGGAGYQSGTFSVQGAGADIWSSADAFRYVYQTLVGDGQIIAKVASQQNTNSWAKAGVMIRETLASNSTHALMALTPGNGSAFVRRLTTGTISTLTAGPRVTAPYWVKLVRSGNTFSGYVASDGINWLPVGSATISMVNTVYVGLAVTSHDKAVLCTSTLNGVSVFSGEPDTPPSVSITAPTADAMFASPATIPITVTAAAGTNATVSRVDFYNGTSLLGSSTVSPYSFSWNNVVAGSYSLTAQITNSLGATVTSSPVGFVVLANALPSPWQSRDIGNVGRVGTVGYQDGLFSLSGSGADIWSMADSFRYGYKQLSGDGQIVARVTSLQNTNAWAKGGVMIRETLSANSTHTMMALTPANGAAFERRLTTGGITSHTAGPRVTAPYWVKLARSGNTFSGYVSPDGMNWVLVGNDTINMANTVYIGLAVTSHNNAALCTVTMDGVQ